MKILVTGGAGYKGTLLTKRLLERGHKVTLMDNFMYGFESVLHLAEEKELDIVRFDIRNIEQFSLENFDVIYHLAGISGYPACEANPHSAEMINVDATAKLVKGLRPEQLLIYASTTSFYGMGGLDCNEASPVKPVSMYGQTKYEGEKIVQGREFSISLRFATIFGMSPKMRVDLLVNDFVCKAVNDRSLVIFDAQSRRTFLHIKDAINAYLFALEHAQEMKGQIFNVGDEQLNFTKLEIAEAIRRQVKYEIVRSSMPDLDVRNFNVSFGKLRQLGFSPVYSLDDGIKELIKLYSFYKPHLNYKII
jgi:nucleoside-diphosphate-sugar epimerase